jgi:RNA polymerase sigma-70 factor (ECF subfamily)
MDYDVVYQNFYPRVLGFFLHSGVGADEARDLTQTVFLRVWKNWKTIDGGTVASLGPWIFTVTRNLFLNHLRDGKALRNRPRGSFVSIENPSEREEQLAERLASNEPDPLDELMASERQDLLHSSIEELPARMKECLLLHLEGFRYHEVATLMQTSIETVKSQLFQAKMKLKKALAIALAGRAVAS